MLGNEPVTPLAVGAGYAAPAVVLDADFDSRWTAWVVRGHVHEQLVRRRLLVLAAMLAMGTAVVYAFVR